MKNIIFGAIFVSLSLTLSGCITIQTHPSTEGHQHGSPYGQAINYFSQRDKVIIHDYYYHQHQIKHHHHREKQHFQHFRRHQKVPKYTSLKRLPYDLERRLNRLQKGYIRIIMGDEVAIMHTRTRVIYDVFSYKYH